MFTEYVDKPYPVRYKIKCVDPKKSEPIVPKIVKPVAVADVHGNWWIALSPEDYLNLASNTDDIIRYIKDQKGVIRYYRKCVIDYNNKIDALNSE